MNGPPLALRRELLHFTSLLQPPARRNSGTAGLEFVPAARSGPGPRSRVAHRDRGDVAATTRRVEPSRHNQIPSTRPKNI